MNITMIDTGLNVASICSKCYSLIRMAEVREQPINVPQVKKDLLTPRGISKTHDPEGRSALASTILGARKEGRSTRDSITGKEQERAGMVGAFSELQPHEEQTAAELTERLNTKLVKLKGKLGLGDKKVSELEAQLAGTRTERGILSDQAVQVAHEIEELKQKQGDIPDPKELLKAYYEKQETQPLTTQGKRELLVPEVLSSLSTEEYIALWRRLNPYFLTHVTRQGFRDHNAMIYHSGGLQEFHSGFVNVLSDEKQLRPPVVIHHGLRTRDEASVRTYLSRWVLEAPNPQEAQERFDQLLHFTFAAAPRYPDETAVHLATQIVADEFYGGERGNEIFFTYPSDVIASQYNFAFNGWEKDFTKPQSETKWNDVFVWPNTLDNPGIPVDAGVVFLPETTLVDPNTGSKYASEVKIIDGREQRVLVEDAKLVNRFRGWAVNLNDDSPVSKALSDYKKESSRNGDTETTRRVLSEILSQELQGLGFSEDAIAVFVRDFNVNLAQRSLVEERLTAGLRESNSNWKRAENPIPAKDYWESYFTKYTDLKPKHIIYYDGDPTTAIYDFQQKNDIGRADTSDTEGQLLGFDDHHVKLIPSGEMVVEQDPRAMVGYRELVEMGNKIIADYYKGPSGVAA